MNGLRTGARFPARTSLNAYLGPLLPRYDNYWEIFPTVKRPSCEANH